ncbi:putative lipoprotein [Streptococcus constellatus subsp. pharyngis SK1060 = CCUG 46377]|uniref:Putative lipoprotein n=1 Tax=Streptococcus constellatus subsp. pharyngis SK1060 = CCUG 46377 TaxID=1035184 RepID=F9P7B2_STRCV|nr:putative lipoprotein [Streptococcus constellatus subsp. pharyngis SK1060 = CCUG 46377]
MKLKKWFGITALAATAVIGLAACGSGNKILMPRQLKLV